mgnify:CR=1 FL=1
MDKHKRYYVPSNGTEGCGFTDHYCANCIHEKFMHTNNHGDTQCEILNNSFLNWPQPIEEWVYDENNKPICTNFKKWDWGKDDDGNWIEPTPPPFDDPNQLVMPFLFDELEIPKQQYQTT